MSDAFYFAFLHIPLDPPRKVKITIDLGLKDEARSSVNSLVGNLAIQEVMKAINAFEYSKVYISFQSFEFHSPSRTS